LKATLFPSSFLIQFKELVIYIDPYFVENGKKADFIFITHEHPDHMSILDIKQLATKDTVIIGTKAIAKKLKAFKVKVVKPGMSYNFDKLSFDVVPAYNVKKKFFQPVLHKNNGNFVGYVLNLGEERIYHAGDTNRIPEMKQLKEIKVAMIPIGENITTMTREEAAQAVKDINPKIIIPMHYVIDKGRVEELRSLLPKEYRIEEMKN
jgi:L-ascorbate metabolism protein UlaG (beta-lactamase superfamily)